MEPKINTWVRKSSLVNQSSSPLTLSFPKKEIPEPTLGLAVPGIKSLKSFPCAVFGKRNGKADLRNLANATRPKAASATISAVAGIKMVLIAPLTVIANTVAGSDKNSAARSPKGRVSRAICEAPCSCLNSKPRNAMAYASFCARMAFFSSSSGM